MTSKETRPRHSPGAREKKNSNGEVRWNKGDLIYADDLTLGYRLDVGIPTAGDAANTDWRALNLRVVDYGQSGIPEIARIADQLMPQVAGYFVGEQRMRFDASYLSSPEQLLPKDDPAPADGKRDTSGSDGLGESSHLVRLAAWR